MGMDRSLELFKLDPELHSIRLVHLKTRFAIELTLPFKGV